MITLDVLIATCNERVLNLAKMNLLTYPQVRYLVIHQVFTTSARQAEIEAFKAEIKQRDDLTIYTCSEQGLAKSRNQALLRSKADICLISDDDVIYLDRALPRILEVFEGYPDVDLVGFQMLDPDYQPVRRYPVEEASAMSQLRDFYEAVALWSPEIAFRRQVLLEAGVRFNEKIGAGTAFPVGEDSLFLADCYRQGLRIGGYAQAICILPNSSTGDREDLPIYFIRGVVWAKVFGWAGTLHQVRKNLIDRCHPVSWLKLLYYLAGNLYYLLKARQFLSSSELDEDRGNSVNIPKKQVMNKGSNKGG